MSPKPFLCDCCAGSEITRRNFLKSTLTGLAVAGSGALPVLAGDRPVPASAAASSETLVATLFHSLTEEQRRNILFPFDHPLRSKVDNNWFITPQRVGKDFTADQQAMIREIFLKMHSPEYAQKVLQQVEHDAGQEGFGACSVALFGEPGAGKFEFVLTGRHVTRRCDGNSVAGAAFGGPIFYGHAALSDDEAADHPGNIYWYQAKRANEVFQMLDGKQREAALLNRSRGEHGTETVALNGRELQGIPISDLSPDQRDHVHMVLADLLAPFRKQDVEQALKFIKENNFEKLHLAFYKNPDIGNDGVWDVWQIEGPAMVWYFRGAPHVHTWVHIREQA
ncbi:MAG TPA: DUF3500 domain-containing protein [Verrucomicrobiae bacterium]|nr:DUF3500 domain-containing protein [Verrucomicrobiae bacterium]